MQKSISLNLPRLKALYTHLGGEARLEEILRDFYQRMNEDVMIGFFFSGKDLEPIIQKQKEFLMRAMGAVAYYTGKSPAQAHENLPPILTGHFDRRHRILEETLRDHGLSEEDIRTWVGFEEAFRDAIVK